MPPHSHARPFIPAAGADFLLPLFDPVTRLLGVHRLRARWLEQVPVRPGERVLDLGAGTGELTLAVKRRFPEAVVTGIDPDARALARARRKADRAGLAVELREAYGDALPFADRSFERAVSSLVLHHLTAPAQEAALREVHRVLVPGGTLHVLDFGPPRGAVHRALAHLLHRADHLAASLSGELPERMRRAGFGGVREAGYFSTAFGTVWSYVGEAGAGGGGDPSSGAPV